MPAKGECHGVGSTANGIASAIFVSVLWGLWHYPIILHVSVIQVVLTLLLLQVAVGPLLSLFWRRSGNLMVPGFVHATIDSVRNALGSAPRAEASGPNTTLAGMGKEPVSDKLWQIIEPLLPPEPAKAKGGRPQVPDRATLTGIIFVLKSGIPWEMLPKEMG